MEIIAEIGSVHDGSFGNACKLIELAAELGADTAKFQTHIAEAETLANAPSPSYFQDESRFEYFQRTAFSAPQYRKMIEHARKNKIKFLSSPFSIEAVDFLEEAGLEVYKVPSGEVSNLPLLERLRDTNKPVLLSSGMSDWRELDKAVERLQGGGPLTIMQCSSEYPCRPESVGLNVITEMKARYNLPVGFSDHTTGMAAALGAVSAGASVIEKHLTFSKKMYGSDAKHSMEPEMFRLFCQTLRELWVMLQSPVDKSNSSPYADMKKVFEKSVVSARPLKAGTVLTRADLCYKKPGDGIRSFEFEKVLGRKLKADVPENHKFLWSDII